MILNRDYKKMFVDPMLSAKLYVNVLEPKIFDHFEQKYDNKKFHSDRALSMSWQGSKKSKKRIKRVILLMLLVKIKILNKKI